MKKRGFTLIELLVVVAIIALLASVVLTSLRDARNKAEIATAKTQLRAIHTAVELLVSDTGMYPGGFDSSLCNATSAFAAGNGPDIDDPVLGLAANDSDPNKYPGWNGPYIDTAIDPWGQKYISESHYRCTAGEIAVLDGQCSAGQWVNAIISGGPNRSVRNQYDSDNIAYVLCQP